MNEKVLSDLANIHASKYTPDEIKTLPENCVFVFGTNPKGKHDSFAAKLAVKNFGALEAVGEGFQGQSYAIPVHKHHTEKMAAAILRFVEFVKQNPEKIFFVLPVGCGKAGMDPSFVSLMFRKAIGLQNIYLPKLFVDNLIEYYKIGVEISEDCQKLIRFPVKYDKPYKVPYGVRVLGKESFCGCFNKVTLPSSLKRIEDYAFCEMGGFESYIEIPSSVEWISDKAFECEYVSPGMLVEYNSYPYNYAKKHGIRYRCTDFDEQKYLEEQKERRERDNAENYGLMRFVNLMTHRIDCNLRFSQIESLPKGQIAIARDFGIVLNDDGHITLVGRNDAFRQIEPSCQNIKVAAAFSGYMALTKNNRIVTGGKSHEFDRVSEIERLSNVADVVACEGHTVALFRDGTVKSIDEPCGWEGVPNHENIVKNWKNIKQVAVGYANVMGLTTTGKVIYHSVDGYTNPNFYGHFNNVVQIDCYSHYYGTDSSMILMSDGTVASDTFEGVDKWKDIIQISVGADIAIGLKKDGTLEVVDDRNTRLEVKQWRDIVSIECKFFGVVGISKRGEILSLFT